MSRKRNLNDTMPMVPLSPAALGGLPRECASGTHESAAEMRLRMERVIARITANLGWGRPATNPDRKSG